MTDVHRVRRGEIALVGAYVERVMLTEIDTKRGEQSRSEWLRDAIASKLSEDKDSG